MKLLSQLKMTEKRIKVISGFLEKTDIKEEVIIAIIYKPDVDKIM